MRNNPRKKSKKSKSKRDVFATSIYRPTIERVTSYKRLVELPVKETVFTFASSVIEAGELFMDNDLISGYDAMSFIINTYGDDIKAPIPRSKGPGNDVYLFILLPDGNGVSNMVISCAELEQTVVSNINALAYKKAGIKHILVSARSRNEAEAKLNSGDVIKDVNTALTLIAHKYGDDRFEDVSTGTTPDDEEE